MLQYNTSVACARLFFEMGVRPENLIMTDSKGVIYKGRTERMNIYKEEFANDTNARTLGDAMVDADVFIGCSARYCTQERPPSSFVIT